MTAAEAVETSVTTINSLSQNFTNLDDQPSQTLIIRFLPRFPFPSTNPYIPPPFVPLLQFSSLFFPPSLLFFLSSFPCSCTLHPSTSSYCPTLPLSPPPSLTLVLLSLFPYLIITMVYFFTLLSLSFGPIYSNIIWS